MRFCNGFNLHSFIWTIIIGAFLVAISVTDRYFAFSGDSFLYRYSGFILIVMLLLLNIKPFKRFSPTFNIAVQDLFLIVYIAYSVLLSYFSGTISYIQWCKWVAAISIYLIGRRFADSSNVVVLPLVAVALLQAVMILLQKLLVINSMSYYFDVSGTFGNPAPPAAIIAVVSALLVGRLIDIGKEEAMKIYILISIFILFILALLMTASRASIFALSISALLMLLSKKRLPTVFLIAGIVGIPIFLLFLYSLRSGSADARLLIWRASLYVFDDNPLFGSGVGSFAQKYMLAQAEFFANHPGSSLSIIATNHSQAYNEFIHLVCEEGIMGAILFSAFAYRVLSAKTVFQPALIAGVLVSLFLYSADMYLLFLILWFLAGASATSSCKIRGPYSLSIFALALLLLVFSPDAKDADFPTYDSVCKEARIMWKDGDYEGALQKLHTAYYMIPSRISAPYLVFEIYKERKDTLRAVEIGNYILKEHKIRDAGNATLQMKAEIRNWLQGVYI